MKQAGLLAFRNDQIHRLCANELHVGARGVEMRVVGDDIALLAHHAEQNALGCAALMSRDHVAIAENVADRIAEVVEALAARVTLVALHNRGPLPGGHGAGAGISEQVDQHIVGRKQKQVVVSRAQQFLPLRACGPADRLNTLDSEGLDDSLRHGGVLLF